MKHILKKFRDWTIIWIGFLLVILLWWFSYAVWVNVSDVSSWDILTAELFNNVINNQRSLEWLWDWWYKEGPTSYSSDYINVWNNWWWNGSSIDCTSINTGCKILKDWVYEVSCTQRSNWTENPYVAIALNWNRAILETDSNAMWWHDHMANINSWTKAEYLWNLWVNDIITCWPPSTYSSDLTYSNLWHVWIIKIIRIK